MPSTLKSPSKTAIIANIATNTGLTKPQIASVLDALVAEAGRCLSDGPGAFVLPGLLKLERRDIPAKPARVGVRNPFKPGETMDIAAKPASVKVNVRALKNLKDMACQD